MKSKTHLYWGLTITLSVCAILVFYDTFFHNGVLLIWMKRLISILKPVLYGMAMAYLLAPVVNFFERYLRKYIPKMKASPRRAVSVFFTWLLVLLLLYILFSILIPQLWASIQMLRANLENYYRIIYRWVTHFLENDPALSGKVANILSSYYNDLVNWVTNSLIPQAQEAIVAVTSGVVSILLFFKDLFVGLCISLYLLGRKEIFAAHTRKLLYAFCSEKNYQRVLKGAHTADLIFSGFVRGKLLDSLIIGLLCFIGCGVLFLPYTPLVSVIVGVTNMIPFFGPILGAVPSAFLILLVNPKQCLYFLIIIVILQQFDGNYLGPKILGDSTGLSGFWVIVAILVGGGFGGVLGMFLGVPVLACIYTAVKSLMESKLIKKGITDDTMFYPADAEKEIEPTEESEETPHA